MPRPIIFDCDPGDDDAVALLVAMASPDELTILGITTVAGNVPVYHTSNNALKICELANRWEIPVFAGCQRPMVKEPISAENFHGQTGMEGETMPNPTMKVQPQHAVDFIIETLKNSPEKITIAITGPYTNVAMALVKEPSIINNIDEIVVMGGTWSAGNITPSAEFNVFVDPHAAHILFTSNIKITMIPLDITHQVFATEERIEIFRALGNEVGHQVANMLALTMVFDKQRWGLNGRAIHDACVSSYLLRPDLFSVKPALVKVEIWSRENIGATIISFYPHHIDKSNAQVPQQVDSVAVIDLITERLSRYEKKTS